MKKYILQVSVLILVLFGLLNIQISAEEILGRGEELSGDFSYKIKDGYACIRYMGTGENIVFPSEINGFPVREIMPIWNYKRANIISITISDGIEVLDSNVFSSCRNLTSVTLPTTLDSIGEQAFYQCTALTSIKIPESVTDIGLQAFALCESLTEANINCKIVGRGMFGGCCALETLNLNGDITEIGAAAFAGCKNLQSVIIPDSVLEVGYDAFFGCDNLSDVVFCNPNTEFKEEKNPNGHPYFPEYETFNDCDNLSELYAFKSTQAQSFAAKKGIDFTPLAHVQLNGETLKFDVPPIIENNRVLVPMRKIFETLGADISWNGETKTITAEAPQRLLTMQIGNNKMQLNGENRELDTAPEIFFDRTLVPVRAVCESLDATVEWNEETQTVVINTK